MLVNHISNGVVSVRVCENKNGDHETDTLFFSRIEADLAVEVTIHIKNCLM